MRAHLYSHRSEEGLKSGRSLSCDHPSTTMGLVTPQDGPPRPPPPRPHPSYPESLTTLGSPE